MTIDPNNRDDVTQVADNGGYVHLQEALETEQDLYYQGGEDSDGDPNHPANVNSRAYNFELDPTDEPVIDPGGHVIPSDLDQVADIPRDL